MSIEVIFQDAIEQLALNRIQVAKQQMEPFEKDERYKEFELFLKYVSELIKFKQAVDERDLSTAYILAHDIPLLKRTNSYANLEIIFNNSFKRAKMLLADDPVGNYRRAEQLLRPFQKIEEKKSIIGHLFNNVDIFLKSEEAIKEQDYERYFKYVRKYDFLENTDIYNKMINIGEEILHEMLDYESFIRYDQSDFLCNET